MRVTNYDDPLQECTVRCPYCDEPISVVIELSELRQDYVEDCQVCCRPIEFAITEGLAGDAEIQVNREDG